jgi:hypothetical protein
MGRVRQAAAGTTLKDLRVGAREVGLAGLLVVLLAITLAVRLDLHLVDFGHYYAAGRALWSGVNPYGSVEVFAPPWLAVVLAPWLIWPYPAAQMLWLLACVGSVVAAAWLSAAWLGIARRPPARVGVLFGAAVMPATLFMAVTGQLSGVVGAGVLAAGWALARAPGARWSRWLAAAGLAAATLKPQVVVVPALICGLTLVRRRDWPGLAAAGAVLAGLAAAAWWMLPGWPLALWQAWAGGAYRGGEGLAAGGYFGLPELGVPLVVFAPAVAYAIWAWLRDGLTPHVMAAAFAGGLLVAPYTRSYDHVVLILAMLSTLRAWPGWRRRTAVGLALAGAVAPLLQIDVVAPVLVMLAVVVAAPRPGTVERGAP